MFGQEKDNWYDIQLDPSLINSFGVLKPQGYAALYCELAERHLYAYDLGSNRAHETGLGWVLVSMTVDIVDAAPAPGPLRANTWKSGLKGPYFLRDYVFYDADGSVCFRGTSHSVLFDLEKRQVFRDRSHPLFSLESDEAPLTEGTATWRQSYKSLAKDIEPRFEVRQERTVQNSFIDLLGHVNNTRYPEFAYDAMNTAEIQRLKDAQRLEIYFSAELRNKEAFSVAAVEVDDRIFFRGTKAEDGKISFDLVLQLGESKRAP